MLFMLNIVFIWFIKNDADALLYLKNKIYWKIIFIKKWLYDEPVFMIGNAVWRFIDDTYSILITHSFDFRNNIFERFYIR